MSSLCSQLCFFPSARRRQSNIVSSLPLQLTSSIKIATLVSPLIPQGCPSFLTMPPASPPLMFRQTTEAMLLLFCVIEAKILYKWMSQENEGEHPIIWSTISREQYVDLPVCPWRLTYCHRKRFPTFRWGRLLVALVSCLISHQNRQDGLRETGELWLQQRKDESSCNE